MTKLWSLKKWMRRQCHAYPAASLIVISVLYATLITACMQMVSVAAYSYRQSATIRAYNSQAFGDEEEHATYLRLYRKHGGVNIMGVWPENGRWVFQRTDGTQGVFK